MDALLCDKMKSLAVEMGLSELVFDLEARNMAELEKLVEIDPLSQFVLMSIGGTRSMVGEIGIVNEKLIDGEARDFSQELFVDRTCARLTSGWRVSKDGGWQELEMVSRYKEGRPAGLCFPIDVSISYTPGIDDDCFHSDECWCAHPSSAPADEHHPECEFRKALEAEDYANCQESRCECDFECYCEPPAVLQAQVTIRQNEEMFGGGFKQWLDANLIVR